MRVSPVSHLLPLARDCLGPEVISIFDYSDSERAYINSLNERDFSFDSFKALLSYDNKEGNHIEVLIPLSILTKEEIQAIKQMR